MIFRYANDDDKKMARTIWKECFIDSENEINFYFNNIYKNSSFLILEKDKKIKASLHENYYKINYNNFNIDIPYIVGVAVLPEDRLKGYMKNLLTFSLKNMSNNRIPFTYLSPINPEIYRKFGFEYIVDIQEGEFCNEHVKNINCGVDFQIIKVTEENFNDYYCHLDKIYSFNMKSQNLYVSRDENYYTNWLGEIFNDGGNLYIFYENSIPKGYTIFYLDEKITIRELFTVDFKFYNIILNFIRTFKEYYPKSSIRVPKNSNFQHYFTNQKLVKIYNKNFLMGRITNIFSFFDLTKLDIDFSFKVYDNIIDTNNGYFSYNNGKLTKTDANHCDFEINIGDLTQLLLGYFDIHDLEILGKIKINNWNIIEKLRLTLTKKNNYILDYQ